ncbi:MAG: tape measure protein [Pseudoflavonifractor sp.]|nr:tape measure protein [Pseudoflavonifractor sp.]
MPEASIVITVTDRYSNAVKSMASVTRNFSKDAEQMERTLSKLQKNRYDLKVKTKEARSELKALEKQYVATGDGADRLKVEMAQAKFTTAQQNLSLVTKGAAAAQRQMEKTGGAFRKLDTSAGGSFGIKGTLSNVAVGMKPMIAQAAQQVGNTVIQSAFGSSGGTVISSAISSAIAGGKIGSMTGTPIGTAIGTVIGGAVGLATGASQVFSQKDDAFKSYVQTAVEGEISQRESDITSGSSIAAEREKDLVSFSTMFKSKDTAKKYLGDLVDMANTTPFHYEDLAAMSKTLGTYGYDENSILPVLRTIGDTGAAKGMSTSDMTMMSTALGRMKSGDKTTLEDLDNFNDRGIEAEEMLSGAYGVDQETMHNMISDGKVSGTKAVEIILNALTESYSGSMEEQSQTFAGLTSNRESLDQEMQNAYGEGYNEARKPGLADQIDYLSGSSGEQMQVANKAIGAWYASMENQKEQMIRDAQEEVLNSADYQEAIGAGTDEGNAEAGRMLMEAKIKAQSEYNASDGAKLLRESELTLAENIRDDTASNDAFWDAGYRKGEQFSKGMAASWANELPRTLNSSTSGGALGVYTIGGTTYGNDGQPIGSKDAFGLNRVPYNDFPALLHEGERVLTASQARAVDRQGGGGAVVQFNEPVYIREDADIERLANAVERRWERRAFLAVPQ